MIQRTGRLSVKQEIIHQMRPARPAAASENSVRQQKSHIKLEWEEMMHDGEKKQHYRRCRASFSDIMKASSWRTRLKHYQHNHNTHQQWKLINIHN